MRKILYVIISTAVSCIAPPLRLPTLISEHLLGLGLALSRIGLEAGPLSPWLYAGLVEAELPAVCVETRHMRAALSARINKTDRNDALGIAQMMRVGLPVHVKTPASQQRRLLLTSRKLLQRKVYDIENDLRTRCCSKWFVSTRSAGG